MTKMICASAALAGLATLSIPRALVGGVRADVSDPKALITQLQNAFEEFKTTHDNKLKAKVDDVLLDEKLDKINNGMTDLETAIDKANARLASAELGSRTPGNMPATDPAYVKAFDAHFRKGDVNAALTEGTAEDGGYLAPVEWDRTVTAALKEISPIREDAQVITISGAGFKRVFNDRNMGSGWVGEAAPRPETATPGLTELAFTPGELYANPAASQTMLDDAAFDVEQWLADEVQYEFARQENIAFLAGNGVNKPFGLLTYVTGAANAAKHPLGPIPAIDASDATFETSDDLYDVIYAVPGERLMNAKWYMNRTTLGRVRKLKDGQGNYLWQPTFQQGEPSSLAGYPVKDVPGMPDIAAGAIPALFGDMRSTYLVIDRVGVRILRDPYTNKPFVHFYTTKRVGGGVQNPEYMRALKLGA